MRHAPRPTRPRRPIRPAVAALALVAPLAACAPRATARPAADAPYDVVITGGRLVDGTGNPWQWADVGIRGDRIAHVAPGGALAQAPARRRIAAAGQVVAPGFIDIQSHSWDALLAGDGRVVGKVAQGVTTEILGEGTGPGAPYSAASLAAALAADTSAARRAALARFVGPDGFGAWLDAMAAHPKSVNVGSYLPAAAVRTYAMGLRAGAADAAALDTMRLVVRRAMEAGAFGVASALIYPPGSYAGTGELVEVARAMAPYHGTYITHLRSEGARLLEATDEALRIGREAGVPVVVYHLKASGRCNWPLARRLVAKLDSARRAGQDVTATMYPYAASGNGLAGGIVPDWAQEDGKLLANLRDPATRARILAAVTGQVPDTSSEMSAGNPDPACRTDPSTVMVLGFRRPELARYNGWRLDAIARDRGQPWAEAMLDLMVAEENRLTKLTFGMSEQNLAMQLARPWVVIGSDAGGQDPARARGLTHPRAYGTFARVLGKYVREDSVLTLEDAVRRMTSATAARLGLADRGLVRPGFRADVVVFDPATVRDVGTYEQPHQLAVGVAHVLVNGVPVWADGRHTGATPGAVVRGPGWTDGRPTLR